jgi:hypothetical protein
MKKLFYIIFLLTTISWGQNFTYSGYVYNSVGGGVQNVEVKLYKRTTPTLAGFTSQNNYNGHSYYRSTGSMTWTDARQACANMGGYLVTVTSAAENNFIFNLWPSGWIGLTDEVVEGQWRWVTGEPYSYSSWNPGEPNNAGNEDYVQFVGGGRWNDLPNNFSLPYVIEFDYIVTFTPWVLHRTVYTDATGRYVINETTNPATEWYFQIDIPTPITPLQNSRAILRLNGNSGQYLRSWWSPPLLCGGATARFGERVTKGHSLPALLWPCCSPLRHSLPSGSRSVPSRSDRQMALMPQRFFCCAPVTSLTFCW